MPLGSVAYGREPDANGERWIWLEPPFVDRLHGMCGPGESYSDVVRLVHRAGFCMRLEGVGASERSGSHI
jgi:hypothetical protein